MSAKTGEKSEERTGTVRQRKQGGEMDAMEKSAKSAGEDFWKEYRESYLRESGRSELPGWPAETEYMPLTLDEGLFGETGSAVRFRKSRREVKEAARIINRYFSDPKLCEKKFEELPISKDRLRHLFREQTGITVQQYLRSCQLRQAAILLVTTSLCICEIAAQVGIPESAYFGQLFRRQYGETPSLFRKNSFWSRKIFRDEKKKDE